MRTSERDACMKRKTDTGCNLSHLESRIKGSRIGWQPSPVLCDEVINILAVGFRQWRAVDEEDVFGVELRASGEIIGAGDDGVIDHQNFVVHEIVDAGWGVRRRV